MSDPLIELEFCIGHNDLTKHEIPKFYISIWLVKQDPKFYQEDPESIWKLKKFNWQQWLSQYEINPDSITCANREKAYLNFSDKHAAKHAFNILAKNLKINKMDRRLPDYYSQID